MVTVESSVILTPQRTPGPDNRRSLGGVTDAHNDASRPAFDEIVKGLRGSVGQHFATRNAEQVSPNQMFDAPRGPNQKRPVPERSARARAADEYREVTKKPVDSQSGAVNPNGDLHAVPILSHTGSAAGIKATDQKVSANGMIGVANHGADGVRDNANPVSKAAPTRRESAALRGKASSEWNSALPSPERPELRAGGVTPLSIVSGVDGNGRPIEGRSPAQQVAEVLGARSGVIRSEISTIQERAPQHGGQLKPSSGIEKGRSGRPASMGDSNPVEESGSTRFDEIVRSIRLSPGVRQSSARIHLDPPELGRVRVDVRLSAGQADIQVRTETSEAAQRVQERAAELKAALEHHGITVDRLEVTVDDAGIRPRDSAQDIPNPLTYQAWDDRAFAKDQGSSGGGQQRMGSGDEALREVGTNASTDSGSGLERAAATGLAGPIGARGRLDIRV